MSSTFTPNLLEMQGFNENSQSWGIRDNTTFLKIDNMINGLIQIDLSSQAGVYILTALQGQIDGQANHVISFIGLLTAAIAIRIPSVAQNHIFLNGTTGGFNLNIGTSGGTAYVLPPASIAMVVCDGLNCFDDRNYISGSLTIASSLSTGPLTVTTLNASGNATIVGTATIGNVSTSNMTASGAIQGASLNINTTVVVFGTLAVGGTVTAGGNAIVNGTLTVGGNIGATGNIYFGGSAGNTIGTNARGTRYISNGTPTLAGVDGDIWYEVV